MKTWFTGVLAVGLSVLAVCGRAEEDEPAVTPVASGKSTTVPRSAASARKAGDTTTVDVNGVSVEMVWIPAGVFMMGSPGSESGRCADETQHRVTLTKGFWMGKYEVTQELWEKVMGNNPSHSKGAQHPVDQVSWTDCEGFLDKLNAAVEGGGFRLPTEAEWEYACRAGTTNALNNGKELTSLSVCSNLNEIAWIGESSTGPTHPVGQKKANAWGLYDMPGNVWEWCQDWYGEYPGEAVTDPIGPEEGTLRVGRGGSWSGFAKFGRSAVRGGNGPGGRGRHLGLRLVRGVL